jgi:hypothetical protein
MTPKGICSSYLHHLEIGRVPRWLTAYSSGPLINGGCLDPDHLFPTRRTDSRSLSTLQPQGRETTMPHLPHIAYCSAEPRTPGGSPAHWRCWEAGCHPPMCCSHFLGGPRLQSLSPQSLTRDPAHLGQSTGRVQIQKQGSPVGKENVGCLSVLGRCIRSRLSETVITSTFPRTLRSN